MYIALATRDTRASHLRVGAVMTKDVVTCAPEDDVMDALAQMKRARVRRLPVVGFGRAVLGVLSTNDIVRAAESGGTLERDVVETLQAICGHHHPVPHIVAA